MPGSFKTFNLEEEQHTSLILSMISTYPNIDSLAKPQDCRVVSYVTRGINQHTVISVKEDVIPPDRIQPMIRKSGRIKKTKKIFDL